MRLLVAMPWLYAVWAQPKPMRPGSLLKLVVVRGAGVKEKVAQVDLTASARRMLLADVRCRKWILRRWQDLLVFPTALSKISR
jgi:hypothetical protein